MADGSAVAKKIARAVAALCVLCVFLAGCGKTESGKKPAAGSSSETESAGYADSSAAVSGEAEKTGSDNLIEDLGKSAQVNLYGRNYYSSGQNAEAFANAAAGFEVKIRGTSLTVTARSVPAANRTADRFSVFIDGEKDSNAKVVEMPHNVLGFSTLTLAEKLPEGEHTIKVLKRTASNQGTTYIKNISTDGVFLQAPSRPKLSIEFFGDSITVGAGVLRRVTFDKATGTYNDSEAYTAETGNVFQSYAGYAASMLDADFRVLGRSGLAMKYSSESVTMLSNCNSAVIDIDPQEQPYNWSGYTPNAVVIYLGTNDYIQGHGHSELNFSYAGLEAAFVQFIREVIGGHYGTEIPIVVCSGQMAAESDLNASMERVANSLKGEFPNIAHVRFAACASGHPTASEAETAGKLLAGKLRELLGKQAG